MTQSDRTGEGQQRSPGRSRVLWIGLSWPGAGVVAAGAMAWIVMSAYLVHSGDRFAPLGLGPVVDGGLAPLVSPGGTPDAIARVTVAGAGLELLRPSAAGPRRAPARPTVSRPAVPPSTGATVLVATTPPGGALVSAPAATASVPAAATSVPAAASAPHAVGTATTSPQAGGTAAARTAAVKPANQVRTNTTTTCSGQVTTSPGASHSKRHHSQSGHGVGPCGRPQSGSGA